MGGFFKSLIFNIVFYAYTLFISVALSFTYILPRKVAYYIVKTFYFRAIAVIEYVFLGLKYRVTGRENIPEGSYILALKHYSAYETLKVPVIFGDIAIILKRELSWIPFWGWYTIKLGMIPVDRGGRQKALASLVKGGKRVISQRRPILIFPQGTRVNPSDTTAEKPYKVGIAKIAETLQLPVVPVALNSGAFWPKKAFIKKSGVVDFKILPAIPAGLPATEVLKRLEAVLEPESAQLIANADIQKKKMSGLLKFAIFLLVLWCGWWQLVAFTIKDRMGALPDSISSPYKPSVEGFPLALDIMWPQVTVKQENGTITMPLAEVTMWPLPRGGVHLMAPQGFTLNTVREDKPIAFTANMFSLGVALPAFWVPFDQWSTNVRSITLSAGATTLSGEGDIAVPLNGETPVNGGLSVTVTGYADLIARLTADQLIEPDKARMAKSILDTMAATNAATAGAITVPFTIRDDVVYVSVIKLFSLADLQPPAGGPGLPPQKNRSDDSATGLPQAPVPQTPGPGSQP